MHGFLETPVRASYRFPLDISDVTVNTLRGNSLFIMAGSLQLPSGDLRLHTAVPEREAIHQISISLDLEVFELSYQKAHSSTLKKSLLI